MVSARPPSHVHGGRRQHGARLRYCVVFGFTFSTSRCSVSTDNAMGSRPVIDGCIYGNRPAAGSAPQPYVAGSRSHSSHPDATWLLAARHTCSAGLGQCTVGSYRHRSLAARCARLVDFLVVSIGVRNLLRGLFLAVSTLSISIAHLRR